MKYSEENLRSLIGLAAMDYCDLLHTDYKVSVEKTGSSSIIANLDITINGRDLICVSIPGKTTSNKETDIISIAQDMRPYLFSIALRFCNEVGMKEVFSPSRERLSLPRGRDN